MKNFLTLLEENNQDILSELDRIIKTDESKSVSSANISFMSLLDEDNASIVSSVDKIINERDNRGEVTDNYGYKRDVASGQKKIKKDDIVDTALQNLNSILTKKLSQQYPTTTKKILEIAYQKRDDIEKKINEIAKQSTDSNLLQRKVLDRGSFNQQKADVVDDENNLFVIFSDAIKEASPYFMGEQMRNQIESLSQQSKAIDKVLNALSGDTKRKLEEGTLSLNELVKSLQTNNLLNQFEEAAKNLNKYKEQEKQYKNNLKEH